MNDYCIKDCPLGIEKSKELLDKANSVYDAAMDMRFFVDECIKTCPHKDKFSKTKEN
jgi:Fe-S-cluster-containing dehydrogenase component